MYDRAGRGWSDPASPEQDGVAVTTDLRTLLDRAHVPGPFVFVGHSSGAAYVRIFAGRYPEQVAGMVLLDAQPSEAFEACRRIQRSTTRSAASPRCCRRWRDLAWDGSFPPIVRCLSQHATSSISTLPRRGYTAACATSSPNCPHRWHKPDRFRTLAPDRWSS